MRNPYIMKEEELELLLDVILKQGSDETYEAMKQRVFNSLKSTNDIDEILMDQYETVLKRVRELEVKDKSDEQIQDILYELASILRILAHDVHREYLKKDKNKNSDRFLHLIK